MSGLSEHGVTVLVSAFLDCFLVIYISGSCSVCYSEEECLALGEVALYLKTYLGKQLALGCEDIKIAYLYVVDLIRKLGALGVLGSKNGEGSCALRSEETKLGIPSCKEVSVLFLLCFVQHGSSLSSIRNVPPSG